MDIRIIEIAFNAYKRGIKQVDEVIIENLDFYADKEDIEKVNELLSFDNFLEIIKREVEEGLTNAYDELLTFLKNNKKNISDILCLNIEIYDYRNDSLYENILKELGFLNDIKIKSVSDLHKLKNIYYDSGYGNQVLHGLIVFKDKTFARRDEYDGSEGWEFFDVNKIIEECMSN